MFGRNELRGDGVQCVQKLSSPRCGPKAAATLRDLEREEVTDKRWVVLTFFIRIKFNVFAFFFS